MSYKPGEGCDAELAFEIDQDMKVGASLLSRSSIEIEKQIRTDLHKGVTCMSNVENG